MKFYSFFEHVCTTGKTLSMARLFRFRGHDGQDYLAAMDTKRAPFDKIDRSEFLDVFRLADDQLLWVPLEEEDIYYLARMYYARWRDADYYIGKYLDAVESAFADFPWLAHALEELEIKILSLPNTRQAALSLLDNLKERAKFIRVFHGAVCSIFDDPQVRQLADDTAFSLLVNLPRPEQAKAELYALAQRLCR